MSDDKSSPGDGGDGNTRRNLPSWMTSRQAGNKKTADTGKNETKSSNTRSKEAKLCEKTTNRGEATSSSAKSGFSKLMDGVVFVLSGFVNPERSVLRSQALEMGAEYKPDWNSDCTLLLCAFSNTPKFRQVETDCGTIVSKEWITECYNQKKLVDIETYLMHAGKPWRKNKLTSEANQGNEITPPREAQKQAKKSPNPEPKPSVSVSTKGGAPSPVKEQLSPSNVKKWAMEDLKKTISWLESQDETPEPSEVKKIAAEGILTCLQDAIESLEQNQDIQQVTEQWRFIPRVVEELVGLVDKRNSRSSLSQKDLCKQAVTCKRIYETEFDSLHDDSNKKKKKQKSTERSRDDEETDIKSRDAGYNSDETLEMTEEEIELAYKTVASKISKCRLDLISERDAVTLHIST